MTMFDLIDDGAPVYRPFAYGVATPEEFRNPVGSQSPKPDLAAALENLMDREVALEE